MDLYDLSIFLQRLSLGLWRRPTVAVAVFVFGQFLQKSLKIALRALPSKDAIVQSDGLVVQGDRTELDTGNDRGRPRSQLLVTTSVALVTSSDALVSTSFLLLLVRH